MIMSQTHIFNFFPGSIHSSRIVKALALFASRQKQTYIPNNQIWLNKLYFQISNSKEKLCLTIDTGTVNDLGPGKFRINANNGEEQTCFFNRHKSDTHFSIFLAKRTQADPIIFSILDNLDFQQTYKNHYFISDNLLFNGGFTNKLEQSNRENFRDGKSFNVRSWTTKSTNVRFRDKRSSSQIRHESPIVRKKTRFLSCK